MRQRALLRVVVRRRAAPGRGHRHRQLVGAEADEGPASPNCALSVQRRLAVECQTGSRRSRRAVTVAGSGSSSTASSSAGCRRSSSASSASAPSTCISTKRPPARSRRRDAPALLHRVQREQQAFAPFFEQGLVGQRAGRDHAPTTLRSTGPLLVAGSPICSQIATDSPRRTSFAR